jgi:signal transduction histidine kinase
MAVLLDEIADQLIAVGNPTIEAILVNENGKPSRAFDKMSEDLIKTTTSANKLNKEIAERKDVEKVLKKRTHDLGERVKELDCLYSISNLIGQPGVLEEMLQEIVELIPPSWQYPEITSACILLESQEYRTKNFRETIWRQASDIAVHGEKIGSLQVFYLKEKPESYEGPFLKEERSLINAIAEQLGKVIDHKQSEEKLKRYQEQLEQLVQERTSDLKKTQKALINKAMEAGMAQMSAMILHNIGNAITPIKVHIEGMKPKELERTLHYLEECYLDLNDHARDLNHYIDEDPRGKEVFAYMGELISSLIKREIQMKETCNKIDGGVSYISDILTLQRAYVVSEQETMERTSLNHLIYDAIRTQTGALEKRGITVKENLSSDLPNLIIDKNRLMQVFVNFIKNSYEAIDELGEDDREKVVSFRSFTGDEKIGFQIKDTGIGIEPDRIGTIFEFGRSNKGSSGFGLHYCKMFVEANRGALKITSPGKGKGATVRVEFDI